MTDGPARVSGKSALGEGNNLRLNAAGRRRLLGRWRFLPLGVFTACTAAWVGAGAVMIEYGSGATTFGLSWFAYAFVTITLAIVARRRVGRVALARWRARGLPAEQVLSYAIEDEGLRVISEATSIRVLWPYVSEIAPAGKYWLLPAGGLFYFLPRRFFETPQAEIDFIAALLARMPTAARERSAEARKLTMFV